MTCPVCKKEFDARKAVPVTGTPPPRDPRLVRCPHCGYEFPLERTA